MVDGTGGLQHRGRLLHRCVDPGRATEPAQAPRAAVGKEGLLWLDPQLAVAVNGAAVRAGLRARPHVLPDPAHDRAESPGLLGRGAADVLEHKRCGLPAAGHGADLWLVSTVHLDALLLWAPFLIWSRLTVVPELIPPVHVFGRQASILWIVVRALRSLLCLPCADF